MVKIIKTEKIRGNLRVYWKIGNRAYLDYHKKTKRIYRLKIELNSNEENLEEKIRQLKNDISGIKVEKNCLEKKLLGFYKENLLKNKISVAKKNIITKNWKDEDDRFILNLVKTIILEPNTIVCFINIKDNNSKWLIGHTEGLKLDFNVIKENLLNVYDCKGGGSPPIWQGVGNFKNTEKKFQKTFEELLIKS